MAHALVVKKEEKVKAVFDELGETETEELFIEKFKEMFPEDWHRIVSKYNKEERHTKHGKTHPMPHPDIYMKNMYRNAKNKME